MKASLASRPALWSLIHAERDLDRQWRLLVKSVGGIPNLWLGLYERFQARAWDCLDNGALDEALAVRDTAVTFGALVLSRVSTIHCN